MPYAGQLEAVLTLAPGFRIATITSYLADMDSLLRQRRVAGAEKARELREVPQQWLHITTLIAGFADEITPDQVGAMASEARRLLARTPPVTITLGKVLYHPRAVMLGVGPP